MKTVSRGWVKGAGTAAAKPRPLEADATHIPTLDKAT